MCYFKRLYFDLYAATLDPLFYKLAGERRCHLPQLDRNRAVVGVYKNSPRLVIGHPTGLAEMLRRRCRVNVAKLLQQPCMGHQPAGAIPIR